MTNLASLLEGSAQTYPEREADGWHYIVDALPTTATGKPLKRELH